MSTLIEYNAENEEIFPVLRRAVPCKLRVKEIVSMKMQKKIKTGFIEMLLSI